MTETGKSDAASWTPRITIAVAILTLVFGGGFGMKLYERYDEQERSEAAKVAEKRGIIEAKLRDILNPLKNQIADNKHIAEQLRADLEPGWGIQETYYIRATRDGLNKHSVMRSRIDSLINGNTEIQRLLDAYGESDDPRFNEAARAFHDHANSYSSRWAGIKEAVENGGDYPTAEPVYPLQFTKAVDREIAKLKASLPKQPED